MFFFFDVRLHIYFEKPKLGSLGSNLLNVFSENAEGRFSDMVFLEAETKSS